MSSNGYVRIGWFITDACNLRCKHCYHKDFSKIIDMSSEHRQLERRVLDEIINLSKTWDIETIGILGGEPLLHPLIFDYVEELVENIRCQITIATNGLLINEAMIEKFKKINNLQLQVSLDSPVAFEHDIYRGNGAYKKSIYIIKKLTEQGVRPAIRMTVSDINMKHMEKFAILGKELGVSCVSINKYISDKNNPSEFFNALSLDKHDEYLSNIVMLKEQYGEEFVITEDPCFNNTKKDIIQAEFQEELNDGLPIGGCSAGLCNITVGTNGDIYPCTLLPLKVGNLKSERLIDIWESENQVLSHLRDRKSSVKGKCSQCDSLLFCGGCRASAYKMKGDYLAEDPFCNKVL